MALKVLCIAGGAALGANMRYFLSLWAGRQFGADFPYGTLIINVTGSFVIGLLLTLGTTRFAMTEATRLFCVTGLLGGYTTFSSFSYEAISLVSAGRAAAALVYVSGSVGVSLAAAVAGSALARI